MHIPVVSLEGENKMLYMNEDIVYLQTDGRGRIKLYTFDQEYQTVQRIEDWNRVLRKCGFIRVDRGTIVNLGKISAVNRNMKVIYVETSEGINSIPVTDSVMDALLHR